MAWAVPGPSSPLASDSGFPPPEGAPKAARTAPSAGLVPETRRKEWGCLGFFYELFRVSKISTGSLVKMHPLRGEGDTSSFPHGRVLKKHCCCFAPWGPQPGPAWVGARGFP